MTHEDITQPISHCLLQEFDLGAVKFDHRTSRDVDQMVMVV